MKTCLECLPCFVAQMADASSRAMNDSPLRERFMRRVLNEAASWPMDVSPPVFAGRMHAILREMSGCDDPYAEPKRAANALVLSVLPALRQAVENADDPFVAALKLCIAGNIIDMGVKAGREFGDAEAGQLAESALAEELPADAVESLRAAVGKARNVFYITDNAGEIVLDRLLVEQLPAGAVTVAVRGGPIINDATVDDAHTAGLDELARVITNGTRYPGTVLEECSGEFRQAWDAADLVISKGQGNFETLSEERRPGLFFLLTIKCDSVASHAGLPVLKPAVIEAGQ